MLFVTVSVIYRPIEQLLSRTIADRRARGFEHDHPLRTPLILQAASRSRSSCSRSRCAGRSQDDLFDGYATLYWILVVAVLVLRGELLRARLARRPPVVRALRRARVHGGDLAPAFALAVAVGIAEGQTAVALGMAAAPLVSLVVVPLAFSRRAAGDGARKRGARRRAGPGPRRALRARGRWR